MQRRQLHKDSCTCGEYQLGDPARFFKVCGRCRLLWRSEPEAFPEAEALEHDAIQEDQGWEVMDAQPMVVESAVAEKYTVYRTRLAR